MLFFVDFSESVLVLAGFSNSVLFLAGFSDATSFFAGFSMKDSLQLSADFSSEDVIFSLILVDSFISIAIISGSKISTNMNYSHW